jgi:hypothetical protein
LKGFAGRVGFGRLGNGILLRYAPVHLNRAGQMPLLTYTGRAPNNNMLATLRQAGGGGIWAITNNVATSLGQQACRQACIGSVNNTTWKALKWLK